jgi:hypothetical protein
MADEAIAALGGIDILVNNAGVGSVPTLTLELEDMEAWAVSVREPLEGRYCERERRPANLFAGLLSRDMRCSLGLLATAVAQLLVGSISSSIAIAELLLVSSATTGAVTRAVARAVSGLFLFLGLVTGCAGGVRSAVLGLHSLLYRRRGRALACHLAVSCGQRGSGHAQAHDQDDGEGDNCPSPDFHNYLLEWFSAVSF